MGCVPALTLSSTSKGQHRSNGERRFGISWGFGSPGRLRKRSWPRFAAMLVVLVLGVPLKIIVADPAFVDVTVSSNLSFVGTYGGTFTGTDGGDAIQRNMGN